MWYFNSAQTLEAYVVLLLNTFHCYFLMWILKYTCFSEVDRENKDGSYFNAAFIDDEGITGHKADDEDILYERRPSPVTMDSDSDDPDAINFRSYSKG